MGPGRFELPTTPTPRVHHTKLDHGPDCEMKFPDSYKLFQCVATKVLQNLKGAGDIKWVWKYKTYGKN